MAKELTLTPSSATPKKIRGDSDKSEISPAGAAVFRQFSKISADVAMNRRTDVYILQQYEVINSSYSNYDTCLAIATVMGTMRMRTEQKYLYTSGAEAS